MYNIDEIKNKIICGDCLEVMKEIPDNSIDTIITDPPYGLNFMGKRWDNFGTDLQKYQEWTRRWAIEALRIAKPGATLLCFGGTRTWHRLACGLEDAGWIIKDTLMWIYGSGFPKATDIAKQLAKKQGAKKQGAKKQGAGSKGNTFPLNKEYQDYELTPEAKQWEGWKSHGLKPAWEPIIMAMKPNEGSYAENALKWGVAGLNIDESRVEGQDKKTPKTRAYSKGQFGGTEGKGIEGMKITPVEHIDGRFPANLIHDGSDEVVACFPNSKSTGGTGKIGLDSDVNLGGGNNYYNFGDSGSASRFFKSILYYPKASKSERNKGCEGLETSKKFTAGNYSQSPTCKTCDLTLNGTNDHSECSGEVYYKEMESKNTKNNHPTVKPLKLMEYLCILTKTPTGGIVLDPFAGSGTTCMAAKKVGRDFIGIEKEPDYVAIAEARIKSIPESLF